MKESALLEKAYNASELTPVDCDLPVSERSVHCNARSVNCMSCTFQRGAVQASGGDEGIIAAFSFGGVISL